MNFDYPILRTHYIAMICGSVIHEHPALEYYYRKMWDQFGPKIEIN